MISRVNRQEASCGVKDKSQEVDGEENQINFPDGNMNEKQQL